MSTTINPARPETIYGAENSTTIFDHPDVVQEITFDKYYGMTPRDEVLANAPKITIKNAPLEIRIKEQTFQFSAEDEPEFIAFSNAVTGYIQSLDSIEQEMIQKLKSEYHEICEKYVNTTQPPRPAIHKSIFTTASSQDIKLTFIKLAVYFADANISVEVKNTAMSYLAHTPTRIGEHIFVFNPQRGVMIFELHQKNLLNDYLEQLPSLIENTAKNYLVQQHLPFIPATVNAFFNLVAQEYCLPQRTPMLPLYFSYRRILPSQQPKQPLASPVQQQEFILMIRGLSVCGTFTEIEKRSSSSLHFASQVILPSLQASQTNGVQAVTLDKIVPTHLCNSDFYDEVQFLSRLNEQQSYEAVFVFLKLLHIERNSIIETLPNQACLKNNFSHLERYAALNALIQFVTLTFTQTDTFNCSAKAHLTQLHQEMNEELQNQSTSNNLFKQHQQLKEECEDLKQAITNLKWQNEQAESKLTELQQNKGTENNHPNTDPTNASPDQVEQPKPEASILTNNISDLESEIQDRNAKRDELRHNLTKLNIKKNTLSEQQDRLCNFLENVQIVSQASLEKAKPSQPTKEQDLHALSLCRIHDVYKNYLEEITKVYKYFQSPAIRQQILLHLFNILRHLPKEILCCTDISELLNMDHTLLKQALTESDLEELTLKLILFGDPHLLDNALRSGLVSKLPDTFSNGYSPLHLASELMNEDLVIYLVRKKVKLDDKSPDKMLLINILAKKNCQKSLLHLAANHKNLFARQNEDKQNKTVFHFLVEYDHPQTLKKVIYTLNKPLWVQFIDKNRESPLKLAERLVKTECVEVLSNYNKEIRNAQRAKVEENE